MDVTHSIEDGIERIVYMPGAPQHHTPILMQHGLWHGAWCWEPWATRLAEAGWAVHTYSLPGHGESPIQRPIRWCTLGYYYEFLKAETARLDRQPVLIGHSMGGALIQWYLKKVADDLPAAIMIAPWPAWDMLEQVLRFALLDPLGTLLSILHLTTTPTVRNPQTTARMFITEGSLLSPEELHAKVGPESLWVLLQYNRLMWLPPQAIQTPMLIVQGEADAVVPKKKVRRTADFYGADYLPVPEAGHDVMLEKSTEQTIAHIRDWLDALSLP